MSTNKATINKSICEAKDVSTYRKLVSNLMAFCERFPMTSVSGMLDSALQKGKSILPKDARALSIINWAMGKQPFSTAINALLNTPFTDLPAAIKPVAKSDNRHEVAFWNVGGQSKQFVRDLISWSDEKGFWSDVTGCKITLIEDTGSEQKEVK